MRSFMVAALAFTLVGAPALAERDKNDRIAPAGRGYDSRNQPADGWITTKVKLALWTTENVRASGVAVDTNDGMVTLYGKVNTFDARGQAERAAFGVKGVRGVKNLLQVVADGTQKKVSRSDKDIKSQAERVLKEERSLSDSRIQVKGVDKGVVLLAGTARTLSDHLRALALVDGVEGVKRVSSNVESPEEFAYAEKMVFVQPEAWSDEERFAGDRTPASSKKERSTLNDMRITSAVKLKLLTTPDVPSTEINVDTFDGQVTLFGIVPSAEARAAAEIAAQKVNGVTSVKDQLEVVPRSDLRRVDAEDQEIEKNLEAIFKDRSELQYVKHEVRNGVVRLTGTVETGWDRLYAVRVVRNLSGARSVEEDIKLSSSSENVR
jgi:osmotically-inducible protein OsmY